MRRLLRSTGPLATDGDRGWHEATPHKERNKRQKRGHGDGQLLVSQPLRRRRLLEEAPRVAQSHLHAAACSLPDVHRRTGPRTDAPGATGRVKTTSNSTTSPRERSRTRHQGQRLVGHTQWEKLTSGYLKNKSGERNLATESLLLCGRAVEWALLAPLSAGKDNRGDQFGSDVRTGILRTQKARLAGAGPFVVRHPSRSTGSRQSLRRLAWQPCGGGSQQR